MRILLIHASVVFVVLLPFPLRSIGDDAAVKERFVREYPRAVREIEAAYRNAHLTGAVSKKTEVTDKDGAAKSTTSRVEFSISGQWAKIETYDGEYGTKPSIAFERISFVGPQGAFRLLRHSRGSVPEVKGIESGDAKKVRQGINHSLDPYLMAATGAGEGLLYSVVSRQENLVGVHELIVDGKKMVSADYEFHRKKTPAAPAVDILATIIVSPDDGWTLQEFTYGSVKFPKTHWGKIEYDTPQQGIPRPKRILTTLSIPDAKSSVEPKKSIRTTTTTFEFERLEFKSTPESEFTLEAFGLGKLDPPPVKPPTRSNSGYWYFGLAVIAFVAAIGLKILASRRARGSAMQPTSGS